MTWKNIILLITLCMLVLPASAGCVDTAKTLPTSTAGVIKSTNTPQSSISTIKPSDQIILIHDDDGSRDGTAALLYLLSIPEIDLRAITISYGEAHPQVYVQHIGRLLDDLGIEAIPLGYGQDMPLGDGTPFPDWLRQFSDNYWDFPLPNPNKTFPVRPAPELMIDTIRRASSAVTIFQSGTFTSLALALQLEPAIKENISAVYFMGGAVEVPGNIRNLLPESENEVAEWNILADPQAAKEVFNSGLNLFMIPLDATNQVLHRREEIIPWQEGDEKAAQVAVFYEIMFTDYGFDKVEIFDLTAAVIAIHPEFCVFQPLHLDVVTENGNQLGQTMPVHGDEPNVQVCLEPNVNLIKQALNDVFSP